MIKTTLRAASLAVALAFGSLHATAQTQPVDPEALAVAEKLVAEVMSGTFADQMAAAGWPSLQGAIEQANPGIDPDILTELRGEYVSIVSSYLGDLMGDMPQIYARYFNAEELRQLYEFQTSELGKKSLTILPQIMQESMPKIMSSAQRVGPLIQQRFIELLKERKVKI